MGWWQALILPKMLVVLPGQLFCLPEPLFRRVQRLAGCFFRFDRPLNGYLDLLNGILDQILFAVHLLLQLGQLLNQQLLKPGHCVHIRINVSHK